MKIQRRHSVPGRFNWEPYLTRWLFQRSSGTVVIYIQISHDETKPKWVRFRSLLEVALQNKSDDIPFVEECVTKYKEWLDSEIESGETEDN